MLCLPRIETWAPRAGAASSTTSTLLTRCMVSVHSSSRVRGVDRQRITLQSQPLHQGTTKSSGTDTSSAQPTGSLSNSSISNQPSSTPGAGPAPGESLSRAEQIGIGAGVAGAGVLVAILAGLFPCRKNYNRKRRPKFRFPHA